MTFCYNAELNENVIRSFTVSVMSYAYKLFLVFDNYDGKVENALFMSVVRLYQIRIDYVLFSIRFLRHLLAFRNVKVMEVSILIVSCQFVKINFLEILQKVMSCC